MRRPVTRVELHRLLEDVDGAVALSGLGERGAAVEERLQRGGAVRLFNAHFGEAAVTTFGRREVLHQVTELFLSLAKALALKALQARRQRDLVVEVGGSVRHRASVCAQ